MDFEAWVTDPSPRTLEEFQEWRAQEVAIDAEAKARFEAWYPPIRPAGFQTNDPRSGYKLWEEMDEDYRETWRRGVREGNNLPAYDRKAKP